MNPFQHSAVAATIYEVLRGVDLGRVEQEDLGDLACTLAEVIAQTHGLELGEPPDRIDDAFEEVLAGLPSKSGEVVEFPRLLERSEP